MHISVEWFDGKYPSFNLQLHSKEGSDPFLKVRGCRIVDGKDGEFVAYPATKNDKTDKWWNHAYGSDKFNEQVLAIAKASMPEKKHSAGKPTAGSFKDFEDDIPF